MTDLKITPFMKVAILLTVILVICFVVAASTIMFDNPEYILAAKKVIVAGGAIGLFFAALVIVFNIAELLFIGIIAMFAAIGMMIVEGWKKFIKDDVLGDE